MPALQGLLKGSHIKQACISHQQPQVPGRLTCSRRSPSSRLSLNARTQAPAPKQPVQSARSCRRHFRQQKQSCSCPPFSACGCRHTTVCGAGTAHPEEVSLHWNFPLRCTYGLLTGSDHLGCDCAHSLVISAWSQPGPLLALHSVTSVVNASGASWSGKLQQ